MRRNLISGQQRAKLLFGLQRAGTTLFHNIVAEYLVQNDAYRAGLAELFNDIDFEVYDRDNQLEPVYTGPNARHPANADAIMRERVALSKKYFGTYFIKIHPHDITPVTTDHLTNDFDWIFAERRNVFDHFLSYAISYTTRRFYQPGGLKIPEHSLVPPKNVAEMFYEFYFAYVYWKKIKKPRQILYYEDYTGPESIPEILRNAGLEKPLDLSRIRLPEVQNPYDKLSRFADPDLLIGLYRKSQMQHICPVSSSGEPQ